MRKILFYCQHLLGVGHLTRSLTLCQALAGPFEVDLLQGGPDIGGLEPARPGFRCVKLPPLLMREDDASLYDPLGRRTAVRVFELRRRAIAKLLRDHSYDHLIVELFPFGRRQFRHEILWLIESLRRDRPGLRVHCSLRDIMVERDERRESETVDFLRRHFAGVLVHSDPRLIRLEETFRRTEAIAGMLHYTGFVARNPRRKAPAARGRSVLVSQGGGMVCGNFVEAAADVAARFPALEFRVALGPHAPADLRRRLAAKARGRPNLRLVGFLSDFQHALAGCGLSVSLAGYNTVMDLLRTRTRGVVFPYAANREQTLRARRFEAAGLLAMASEADLRRERFAALLRRELRRPYPEVEVDLSGAEHTRDHLLSLS